MPTHEIKYTENGGDVPVHYADTIIIDNGTVYTVVYHAQLNEYNTYDDVAILMIDSFQPAPGSQITAPAPCDTIHPTIAGPEFVPC